MSIPIALSPARGGGVAPQLSLNYDSAVGNGLGLGWQSPPRTRKIDKGCRDISTARTRHLVLSGAED
jgi:hypothetical protein